MRRDELAAAFTRQAGLCAAAHAPLYAELCRRCSDDLARGGRTTALVLDFVGDPAAGALPLRLLAGVNARVLAGDEPELARHWPSTGGTAQWPATWDAFASVIARHEAGLRPWLGHPPQTNEVGRSALLLAGMLTVVAPARPVHLLEIGASAGLNLRFDRYDHWLGNLRWGDASSAVKVRPEWRGAAPPMRTLDVASRRACDLRPIDVGDQAARARLLAYVWPDHLERIANLRGALALAERDGLRVETAEAGAWLAARLAEPPPDGTTVVFHSSVWGYLAPEQKQQITATLHAAGARRRADQPVHWLRWEDPPGSNDHELRCWSSTDPAHDRLLARGHPHGRWVAWCDA